MSEVVEVVIDRMGKDSLAMHDYLSEHGHWMYMLDNQLVVSDPNAVQQLIIDYVPAGSPPVGG
ncbi:MAG: hypothetical protein VXW65_03925 [Pseudomonadota bacterium]|nr:hypothetical protein [Pseudomonadota bacterium]